MAYHAEDTVGNGGGVDKEAEAVAIWWHRGRRERCSLPLRMHGLADADGSLMLGQPEGQGVPGLYCH